MAYQDFAYWYDALNADADYDRLAGKIISKLKCNGVGSGIVVDLGCGTGEMTLRLAKAGYDMIAVDGSSDMLSVLREKTGASDLLLLCQNLAELELYGTVRAAVSTFDTLNHLDREAFSRTVERTALFTEPGGVFIFDMNTPYKHTDVLASNTFELDGPEGTVGYWENQYDSEDRSTQISIEVMKEDRFFFSELFTEYSYNLDEIETELAQAGFRMAEVIDGEAFSALVPTTQRYLITAIRQ